MTTAPLVCIVDDAADYLFLVETIFKRYLPACSLRSFDNGQAFLDALPQLGEKPDLILLDQYMPQLSGYQTLTALRKQTEYRFIPVVMISADMSPSNIINLYQAGASKFLPKPMNLNALSETIFTACQQIRRHS